MKNEVYNDIKQNNNLIMYNHKTMQFCAVGTVEPNQRHTLQELVYMLFGQIKQLL